MLLLAGAFAAAGVIGLSCVDDHPRDQYYGTDAGSNFVPGVFDAPIDSPAELDGGIDGMDSDAL